MHRLRYIEGEKRKSMQEDSWFPTYDFMIRDFNLKGNNLLVFALIYSYTLNSEEKCFRGSKKYIAERLGISLRSVQLVIESLYQKRILSIVNFYDGKYGFIALRRKREVGDAGFLTTNPRMLGTPYFFDVKSPNKQPDE